MVIVKDNRPRDWTYQAVFNRKDLPALEEMARHIRETHDTDMIEDLNQRFENKSSTLSNGVEIQSVTKTEDLTVNVGLQQCINIILGTSSARWSHMQVAIGTTGHTPAITDINIDSSGGAAFPIAFSAYGWMESRGMKLFFGAIVPQDQTAPLGATSISSIGVFNGTSTGPTSAMFNHENFFNNKPTRTADSSSPVFNAVFIFSCVIEFCPAA